MSISLDTSVARFVGTGTFSGSPVAGTTPSAITVPAGTLLVACLSAFEDETNPVTSSSLTTSGLTWTRQIQRGSATNGGGTNSEGYAAIFTAPDASGGSRNVASSVGYTDNFIGFSHSVKIILVSGQHASPIGGTSSAGPTSDSGTGISPVILNPTTGAGRMIYCGAELASGSGSPGVPTSSDSNSAEFTASLLGSLAAWKSVDHSASASISGNLDAAGATFWNWVSLEILASAGGGGSTVKNFTLLGVG